MALTKQALSLLVTLPYCLFVFMPSSLANTNKLSKGLSKELNKKLSPEVFDALHQCHKTFEYDIYLLKNKVGNLHRTIKWHKNEYPAKARVTSHGKVSFLWLNSTYEQSSTMQYSPKLQYFLTPSFSQKIIGFKAREMTALISDDGLSSRVTLDNEDYNYHYEKKDKDAALALYDLDTLGAQIRLNLLQGKTHFTLLRQASNKIDSYQFEVTGHEVINHKVWGQFNTIKVIEVGNHKNTVLWFSSKHDHQLVKAQLDLIFSPTVWLTHYKKDCEL